MEYLIGTDAEEASCGEAGDGPHAVAIDLGTTTLSLCLVDLGSGRSLCTIRARNPQRRFGADVISRIGHVRQRGQSGLDALQGAVVDALNRLLERLCETTSIRTTSIRRAVIAGNPTMLHLLLGVSPVGIDVSPFTPAFLEDTHCEAETVGLCLGRGARVETLPAASAYVGADVVAGLLAIDLAGGGERALFVDVGTNGEVVLAIDGRLAACSTAAGPAFEGASIAQGMLAAPGAISSVRIHDGVVVCNVIGGGDARGLCGTGLVAAVAELRRVGGIDASGRFHPDRGERWEGHGKLVRFRLSDGPWPVYLTQQDVREFQLAKAALRAGVECLLERAGVPARDLDAVRVGGAFSSGLQGAQLVETGLLPGIDRERIRAVGNTALQGATCCLLDPELALSARDLANRIGVVELSGDPRFLELYVAGMAFPGVEGGATQ